LLLHCVRAAAVADLLDRGHKQRDQDRNNRDHDKQLDQREARAQLARGRLVRLLDFPNARPPFANTKIQALRHDLLKLDALEGVRVMSVLPLK